ncbi:hypothetical protein FHS96_004850 [Sphingomonas zeicaulis]
MDATQNKDRTPRPTGPFAVRIDGYRHLTTGVFPA